MAKLVAITACPTGIAHTFMAASALEKFAQDNGHEIKVETQGSVGAKNKLTQSEIENADVVIIAADTHVEMERFDGKRFFETSTAEAIKNTTEVLQNALRSTKIHSNSGKNHDASLKQKVTEIKEDRKTQTTGAYKHLLTGVSYMLPIVVAGGLLIALSFVFGIEAFKEEGTLAAALMNIGGGAAFHIMVAVLSGYIAFSIADRPGLAPGLIGGMLASNIEAGFLGGIISGFLAGYVAKLIVENIKLPENFEGLMPVLVVPLLATLVVGLVMIYIVGEPVSYINEALKNFLEGMSGSNAILIGLILGLMMAFDMGGPVNKAAYTVSVGLLANGVTAPMAAAMAAGMTPPLGIFIATMIAKNKFDAAEHQAGKAAGVLGICFITEGAIPFAVKDPLRVIPSLMLGSGLTGAMSMGFGCTLAAPHGGIFVLAIPNAVTNLGMYAFSILAGALVTAIALSVLKKPITSK
ncbi:fructose-specific PTS transporter subunit EIIC [Halarcobacter sp.]|uniref:fructose-specific PTS transporter subunit EIIC n=1 Tax=Halarcobacter sp. TaxID=2321133 RepID=UPI002AA71537|nr:fructose-specific PTS transporter subunit EIIC [Halarcobacter sp.]